MNIKTKVKTWKWHSKIELSRTQTKLDSIGFNVKSLWNDIPPFDQTQIQDKYKCSFCKNVLKNTHQADDCGCRYCYKCLIQM